MNHLPPPHFSLHTTARSPQRDRRTGRGACATALLCGWLCVSTTSAGDVAPPAAASAPVVDAISASVGELFEVFEREGVNTSRAENSELSYRIQKAIVEELVPGAMIRRSADAIDAPLSAADHGDEYISTVIDERTIYIGLRGLGPPVFSRLLDDLGAHGNGNTRYRHVILDLRFAADVAPEGRSVLRKIFDDHRTLVLTNRETRGTFEFIARDLRQHVHALLLGEPTAGRPFQYRTVTLSSGAVLVVPLSTTEVESDDASGPVAPDIAITSAATSEQLRSLANDLNNLKSDPLVHKALEIIKASRLFGRQRF